jgi:protein-tyrosine-phosphatase
MAEAFLRKYAGDYFDVYSAGFEPEPIHPYADLGYERNRVRSGWPIPSRILNSILGQFISE